MVANILSDPKVITAVAALAAFAWWQSTRTTANLLTAGGSRLASGAGTVYGDLKTSGGTAYSDVKSAYGTGFREVKKQGSDAKKAAKKIGGWLKRRL